MSLVNSDSHLPEVRTNSFGARAGLPKRRLSADKPTGTAAPQRQFARIVAWRLAQCSNLSRWGADDGRRAGRCHETAKQFPLGSGS
jgi:hypothetical protein